MDRCPIVSLIVMGTASAMLAAYMEFESIVQVQMWFYAVAVALMFVSFVVDRARLAEHGTRARTRAAGKVGP